MGAYAGDAAFNGVGYNNGCGLWLLIKKGGNLCILSIMYNRYSRFWGPFLFGRRRRRLNTISGIPVLKTTGVVATSTEVRYDVNYQEYRSLPNEGLFFLDIRQSSAEASAALPVGLSDGNSENNNQSMLRNALQEDVQAGNLQLNFRYLIYYNKCNNVYQLVNAYPANITAPSA